MESKRSAGRIATANTNEVHDVLTGLVAQSQPGGHFCATVESDCCVESVVGALDFLRGSD